MTDDRDESGRYNEMYPDESFIDAVGTLDVASTQNIADEVGCSYDLAYRRMKQLEDESRVTSQKVGSAFVWLIAWKANQISGVLSARFGLSNPVAFQPRANGRCGDER